MHESRSVLPDGWPRPKGYSEATLARIGDVSVLTVAGQLGIVAPHGSVAVESGASTYGAQYRTALCRVCELCIAAGARPQDIANLRIYVRDIEEFQKEAREIGGAHRDLLGGHFPAMTLLAVAGLVDGDAVLEVEATAYFASAGVERG